MKFIETRVTEKRTVGNREGKCDLHWRLFTMEESIEFKTDLSGSSNPNLQIRNLERIEKDEKKVGLRRIREFYSNWVSNRISDHWQHLSHPSDVSIIHKNPTR